MHVGQEPDPNDHVGLASGFRAWWAADPDPAPFVRKGIVILDANALLHVYRITPAARGQILMALSEVQDRLWVPHQAALEFHRNRNSAVSGRLNQFTEIRKALKGAAGNATNEILRVVENFVGLHQRNMTARTWDPSVHGLDKESILARLDGIVNSALDELKELEAEHDLRPRDMKSGDPILEQLEAITRGKIGAPYRHSRLRELVEEALSFRFPNSIPPGYKDAASKSIPYAAAGDYILWRQVLDFAAVNARGRPVVLVTNDVKEDWWELDEHRKARRGRPELRQEMFDNSRTEMLQMTLSSFLEVISAQFPERVSLDTVDEVRESEVAEQVTEVVSEVNLERERDVDIDKADEASSLNLLAMHPADLERLVADLFRAMGHTVIVTPVVGYPGFDIDASTLDPAHGVVRTLVQVKGYRSPVGAEAVHGLFGVMVHENAPAAVLVTTSRFSTRARQFADGKNIGLIEGVELVDLIRTHLGLDVTISGRDRSDG